MKLNKSDIILIFLVIGISMIILICCYLYFSSKNYSKTDDLISVRNRHRILPLSNLAVSALNNVLPQPKVEKFRMPYDKDYVDPFMFYAEVTLENDPEELEEDEFPSPSPAEVPSPSPAPEPAPAPAPALVEEIIEDPLKKDEVLVANFKKDPKFKSDCEELETPEKELTHKYKFRKDSSLLGTMYEMLFHRRCTNLIAEEKKKKQLDAYQQGSDDFFKDCMPIDNEEMEKENEKAEQERLTHRYQFARGSTLIGTMYEKLFDQKCTTHHKNKAKLNRDKLKKLQVTQFLLDKLHQVSEEFEYLIKDEDIKNMDSLILEAHPEVEKKIEAYLTKKAKQEYDQNNMYLTKKSNEGENRVDTIQSLSNNNEKYGEGENKLTMCLKRYKGDEDRCFLPRKNDKKTFCQVPECFNPLLVIGSCSISAYDMEPFYFETNAHFRIEKHPEFPSRRIIYLNSVNDPRRCESDPAYFNNYLEVLRHKKLIEIITNDISLMKTNQVKLTPEQEKEYEELALKIKEIEGKTGKFDEENKEGGVDYHQVSKERNMELRETKDRYENFKQKIRDEKIEELEEEKKKLEEKLEEYQNKDKEYDLNEVMVSKRICLKYNVIKSTPVVKLLYEDDARNLEKDYKSDWYIEKYFDKQGNDTEFYKIRAEVGKKKFNLSKKPRPKDFGFVGFALPVFEPSPKMEDQLWMIKEVGDLNEDMNLGETKEEIDIKRIEEEKSEAIATKHEEPGAAEFEPLPKEQWDDNIEKSDGKPKPAKTLSY